LTPAYPSHPAVVLKQSSPHNRAVDVTDTELSADSYWRRPDTRPAEVRNRVWGLAHSPYNHPGLNLRGHKQGVGCMHDADQSHTCTCCDQLRTLCGAQCGSMSTTRFPRVKRPTRSPPSAPFLRQRLSGSRHVGRVGKNHTAWSELAHQLQSIKNRRQYGFACEQSIV